MSLDRVRALHSSGQFAVALSELHRYQRTHSSHEGHACESLLSELLLRTGDPLGARQVIDRVLKRERSTAADRAKALLTLSVIQYSDCSNEDAFESAQKAHKFAITSGEIGLIFESQLQLLTVRADSESMTTLSAPWTDLRKSAYKTGDPHSLVQLYLCSARIHGQRGEIALAKRFLTSARKLLEHYPHLWLSELLEIRAAAIFYAEGAIEESLEHATKVYKSAAESGHSLNYASAVANLGQLHLLLGHPEAADKYLHRGLSLSENDRQVRLSVLDSLAQLALLRRDLITCAQLLARVEEERPATKAFEQSWLELALRLPRIQLGIAKRDFRGSCRLAAAGLRLAKKRADPLMVLRYQLLYAKAVIGHGDLAEAARILRQSAVPSTDLPLSARAELEHVRGIYFQRRLGTTHSLRRAIRLFGHVGNACMTLEAVGDYAQGLGVASQTRRSPSSVLVSLRARPRRTFYRPETTTQVRIAGESQEDPQPDLSALLDFAAHPELLGREAFDLCVQQKCTTGAALIARSDHDVQVLAVSGWSYPRARALAAEPPNPLALGTSRGRDILLLVEPADDLIAAERLMSIRKLVQAAVALEAARQEQKRRAALWPEEPVAEAAGGLFISAQMLELLDISRRLARTDIPVLITGETGTGKELIAQVIHRASPRSRGTFLAFNCNAVPREMLDSQLFGYARGAFTGAVADFPGVLRSATGGTVFLDEIGELGLELQPKLLRFLETREVHPLGERRPVTVDVRIVAATNANLERLVSDGRFREDLYYRLNVVRLKVPPLRERREEIPQLAQTFLERFSREVGRPAPRISDELLEYLVLYRWPGNVRQLLNEMRRLVATAEHETTLMPEHLTGEIRASRRTIAATEDIPLRNRVAVPVDQPLPAAIEFLERAMVAKALEKTGGRLEPAAELLGISRKGLYLKRHRLGLGSDYP